MSQVKMNAAKPLLPSLATFSCPELCNIIARYLSQTDLYRCLLVNKTFSKNLFPYLWRHISFSDWVPYYSDLCYLDKQQKELVQSGVDVSEDMTSTSASSITQTPKRGRQKRPVIDRHGIPNPWAAAAGAQLRNDSELFLPPQPPFASLRLHGHLVETLTLEWDEGQDFLPEPKTAEYSELEEAPGVTQTWIYICLMQQCPNIRALKIVGRNTEVAWIRPRWMHMTGCQGPSREEEEFRTRREAKDRCLAKVIWAAGRMGGQQRLVMSALDGEGGGEGRGGGAETQVRAQTEARATADQGIEELYLSNSYGFSEESFKALIQAFAPPHPAPPAPMIASQSQDDSPPSSLPPRPQLRVLDISACGHIQHTKMATLLERFPGLQVVDFRCRENLSAFFSNSGLQFDGWHNVKARQTRMTLEMSGIAPPMFGINSIGTGSDGESDQGITYKPWPCEASLRVLRTGIARAIMCKDRLWLGPFTPTPAPTQPGEGPFDSLSRLEYPACFEWFYNHLARLTNLRELCLVSVRDSYMYEGEVINELQFTIEEGLYRLVGLRRLEILDVEYLRHRIGLVELQWMVKHWPMLKVIRGLIFEEDAEKDGEGVDVETMEGEEKGWSEGVRWLKMTRPDIELPVLEKRWKWPSSSSGF